MTTPTRLAILNHRAHLVGMSVDTYSPGDGVTRYRFFRYTPNKPEMDYFAGNGLYTALGYKEAVTFLQGAMAK